MRRMPDGIARWLLYAGTTAVIVVSFLAQIARGECPVP